MMLFTAGVCAATILFVALICLLCISIESAIHKSKKKAQDIAKMKRDISLIKNKIIGGNDENKYNRKRRD